MDRVAEECSRSGCRVSDRARAKARSTQRQTFAVICALLMVWIPSYIVLHPVENPACLPFFSPQPICLHLMQWRCAWSPQGSDFAWSHSVFFWSWIDHHCVGGNIHKAHVCDMIPIKQIARIFDLGIASSALMNFVRYYSTFLPTPSTLHLAPHLDMLTSSNNILLYTIVIYYKYVVRLY